MITITRALARQFRAVLRKALPSATLRSSLVAVVCQAGPEGLRLRLSHQEAAVEYHQPDPRPTCQLTLPVEALADCEGRQDTNVTLDAGSASIQARWDDHGVPQVREYTIPIAEKLLPFPDLPAHLTTLEPGFLQILDAAVHTAARENVRYAVTKLQLRGGTGDVISTDGRQLLVQGGFTFPWQEDVLIPAINVFGCRELPPHAAVALGKTDSHACLRVGAWTFLLALDKEGRFPAAQSIIPKRTDKATTWRLSPEDVVFLTQSLPRLPGKTDDQGPVTLDLDREVVIRAKAEGQSRPTELVLAGSEVSGPAVRLVTPRQYLARALDLGFTKISITNADVPVVCRDGGRTYVWMLLDKASAVPPCPDALRISSSHDEKIVQQSAQERSDEPVSYQQVDDVSNGKAAISHNGGNGHRGDSSTTANNVATLIEEVEGLRNGLRDVYTRSSRLVTALKRHRKQSRLMATTLASLRQLQQFQPLSE